VTKKEKEAKLLADAALMAAATKYELSKRECARLEKDKKSSKKLLLAWLGPDDAKTLPDGRIVSKSSIDMDAETTPRSAYVKTSLVITHPLAAYTN
jgi:hypothetical protein